MASRTQSEVQKVRTQLARMPLALRSGEGFPNAEARGKADFWLLNSHSRGQIFTGSVLRAHPEMRKIQPATWGNGMPNLVFHGEEGEASVSLADELSIGLASGKLEVGGGPSLASHRDGSWWIGNVVVSRITCDGPIALLIGTD